MSTPQSSLDAYATPTDMVIRHDARVIAQLCSDSNTALTQTALLTNPRLLEALRVGSGMLESACMVGGAYTPTDLQTILGTVSGSLIKAMVCDLALGDIWRPERLGKIPDKVTVTLDQIELLRKGARVFGLLDQQNAGKLSDYIETAADVENRRNVVIIASRFFGTRANQLNG